MAFEEEKILLKSNLCTQESFIVWCRSRFLLYNVIKELNCKDLLSFDLLSVLHSCTLLPMQIASEHSKVRSRKLALLPEKILTNIGKYWKTLNNTEIYLKTLKKIEKMQECADANCFGAVEGQRPKVGSVAGKSGFVWNFISSQDFRGSSWQLCPFLRAP